MDVVIEDTQTGNNLIVQTIKELLYQEREDIFDYLDFEDDNIYREPLLYTYLNYKHTSSWGLDQVIWGYIPEDKRPLRISVVQHHDGVIYIPNYGYMKTTRRSGQMHLSWSNGEAILSDETGINVPFEFCPLIVLDKYGFEVIRYPNELTDNLFIDESGQKTDVITLPPEDYLPTLERMLSIIEHQNPTYFKCLELTVKKFYLYTGTPNSFAGIAAHGMAFFNVQPNDSAIFFLDNIIHQCAHVIFNAISFEKEKWFTVPPATLLSEFTNDARDNQAIYGKYHGLFTQTNINMTLDKCIDSNTFEGDELIELLGRFSSNMSRFASALVKLNHPDAYTSIGKNWFNFFHERHDVLLKKRGPLISLCKVDNQPYVFSYKLFKDTNHVNAILGARTNTNHRSNVATN